jgi:hypothetical protein
MIAFLYHATPAEIAEVAGVKGWFAHAFAEELVVALQQPEETPA